MTGKVVELGQLSLFFARTNRITFHEDGITPESDTDHTIMLGLCACAIASSYAPHLDLGKVAQFALIHDLVEAYAGDTPTLTISDEGMKKKDKVEHEALLRITSEFEEVFPWIHNTIQEYESLDTEEAKFIKTLDKCMPKITHVLNGGTALKPTFKTKQEAEKYFEDQNTKIKKSYGSNHKILINLHTQLGKEAVRSTYGD